MPLLLDLFRQLVQPPGAPFFDSMPSRKYLCQSEEREQASRYSYRQKKLGPVEGLELLSNCFRSC